MAHIPLEHPESAIIMCTVVLTQFIDPRQSATVETVKQPYGHQWTYFLLTLKTRSMNSYIGPPTAPDAKHFPPLAKPSLSKFMIPSNYCIRVTYYVLLIQVQRLP